MIKTGDIIENPITVEKIQFLQTGEDTKGVQLKKKLMVKPDSFVVAPHIHPVQEEHFLIKSGTIRLQEDSSEWLLSAGHEGTILPGLYNRNCLVTKGEKNERS
jgi:uncharacterized cupin superfamily protein